MLEIIEDYEVFRQNQKSYSLEERKRIRDDFRERIDNVMLNSTISVL